MEWSNNRIQLGLASVMFFTFLVQSLIRDENIWLTADDKDFIQGYITFWYINIVLLIATIVCTVLYYFIDSTIFYWLHTFFIFTLLFALVIGCIGVLTNTHFVHFHRIHAQSTDVTENKTAILKAFLPGYNIYTRYQMHSFQKPYWWLKESVLRRTIIVLVGGLLDSDILMNFVFVLMVLRLSTLWFGMDYITPTSKAIINNWFSKNPEELMGYVTGSIVYLYHRIFASTKQLSWNECVHEEKQTYNGLYPIHTDTLTDRHMVVEYTLWGLVLFYGLLTSVLDTFGAYHIVVPVLLLLRYGILYYYWKHLPYLPVIHEIVVSIHYIITHKAAIAHRIIWLFSRKSWK